VSWRHPEGDRRNKTVEKRREEKTQIICPACGSRLSVWAVDPGITAHTTCPRCLADVRKPERDDTPVLRPQPPVLRPQPPDRLDQDVRRDQRGVVTGIGFFAIFGGCALVCLVVSVGPSVLGTSAGLVVLVPLALLAVVVFVYSYFRRPQGQRSVGQAAGRALAGVGVTVAVLFLAACAVLIVAFVSCLANPPNFGR
jgi:hypothetical protein